jgi:uncharacterized protein
MPTPTLFHLRASWFPATLAVVLLVFMLAFTRMPVVETRIDDLDIEGNPYTQAGMKMAELFGAKNLVQVVVEPSTTDMAELATALDTLMMELKEAFPGLRVETINKALPLIYGSAGRQTSVKQALTAALDIPVARNLVSRDTTTVLLVAFTDRVQHFDSYRFDSILSFPRQHIGAMTALSAAHIENQTEKSITDDYALMIPLFLLFFIALIYFSYNSISAILFCIINLVLSFIPVMFFITIFDVNINQVTMPALPVVAILSLSASVHLLTGFRFRHDADTRSKRIISTINHYRIPTFLSTLTTSVSFCSFYLSDSLYIRQFGLVAGCSIMVVFVVTFLLAPFTLQLVKEKPAGNRMPDLTSRIEKFLFRNRTSFSMVLLFIALLSVFFVSRISFSANIETYIPRGTPVYQSMLELQKGFHSLGALDVLIESSAKPDSLSRGMVRRELVSMVSELSGRIAKYPGVTSVESVKDQIDFEKQFVMPGIRMAIFPRANNPYVSKDQLHYRISIRISDPDHIPDVKELLAKDFQSYQPNYVYSIYSDYLYFQYISTGISVSLLRSLLVSALFIVVVIFFLTFNLKKTLISILVNTIPLAFMVFILVIFGVDMNITTSISLVICLGLIVDDTIQILYRRVRLREPMGELGFGIITSSLLVTGGFLTFLISNSHPNQVFGLICATVFTIAAISDLTVMPWLMRDKMNQDSTANFRS